MSANQFGQRAVTTPGVIDAHVLVCRDSSGAADKQHSLYSTAVLFFFFYLDIFLLQATGNITTSLNFEIKMCHLVFTVTILDLLQTATPPPSASVRSL